MPLMEKENLNADVTEAQFEQISSLVRNLAGINLHNGKKELVKTRLAKRLRQLQLRNIEEYLSFVRNDRTGRELVSMLDVLSTNLTSFFREPQHFHYLKDHVLPRIMQAKTRRIRIWSAGCSSGEEPYSIAVLLNEMIPDIENRDVRILATDLSTCMLEIACRGEYEQDRFKDTDQRLISKYFECMQTEPEEIYQARPSIRSLIHFARLNLMDDWPMKGPFDVIFCRNVAIYFTSEARKDLFKRLAALLTPEGYMFVGSSESLADVGPEFAPQHHCRSVFYQPKKLAGALV